MFPVYAQTQDDTSQRKNYLLKSIYMNALIITPIIGLLIFSTELITLLFGQKWEGSLIVIKIIGVASIIQIISNSYPTIMRANNLSHIELRYKVLSVFFVFLPAVFVGTYYFGIVGCSTGVLIAQFFIVVFNLFGIKKYLSIPPKSILSSYFKGIRVTVLCGILITFIFYFFDICNESVIILKSVSYMFLILLFNYFLNKSEILKLIKLIKSK
jgi:O-antigen/teichoic acid export membrane protein